MNLVRRRRTAVAKPSRWETKADVSRLNTRSAQMRVEREGTVAARRRDLRWASSRFAPTRTPSPWFPCKLTTRDLLLSGSHENVCRPTASGPPKQSERRQPERSRSAPAEPPPETHPPAALPRLLVAPPAASGVSARTAPYRRPIVVTLTAGCAGLSTMPTAPPSHRHDEPSQNSWSPPARQRPALLKADRPSEFHTR